MPPAFKLISSNSLDLFEERMNEFVKNLPANSIIVEISFSTAPTTSSIEYSALIHYQATQGWE